MATPEITRTSGSVRRNSSRFWRSSGGEVFSRSAREEDDEEALKWAAMEKLPTYNRLKKGLLKGSEGDFSEVEIEDLGSLEKKNLVERLVKTAEEDNEQFLLNLKSRLDKVGISLPEVEVRFEHLTVNAEAHVGSRALPSFINFYVNALEALGNSLHILPSKKKKFTILTDASGIIKPGRMTLLLGPPSSGKTTLLLALCGKLDPDLKVTGKVTYNGHGMDEFSPQRTAAYIGQHDKHIGEMTVRETLAFSARCQGVGFRYEMLAELARREKAANIKPDLDIDMYMKAAGTEGLAENVITEYILKILGLDICADTMVGNEMVRGVSGGQKKRVTTGEMMVGPATALFMDEISTGLDSSTTYQIVNCLKQNVNILKGTAFISLLQPAPETYDLFDDIVLVTDGLIVYQGPRENVLEFFESMGFKCPQRKGVADYLQEVTSRKDQEQYWDRKDQPYRLVTAKEFAEAFQSFHIGQKLGEELAIPYDKTKSHPAALTTKKYGVSNKELLDACMAREALLMKRNAFIYLFKLFQLLLIAFISFTLFIRAKMHRRTVEDGNLYTSALFVTVIAIMFNGMVEIVLTIDKLGVFYKQRDLLFYPPWAFALPTWILRIPTTLVEVVLWVALNYYTIGFDPNAGRFFRQLFILILLSQMASALYKFIAAVARNMIVATTMGSFAILFLFALGGFVLSRDAIKHWWIWGYWCSPLMYVQNAVMVNEFLGHTWRHKAFANSTLPLGVELLESRGFFTRGYWYWIGFGAMIGFLLLFNFCYTLALTFLKPYEKPQAMLTEESENDQPPSNTNQTASAGATSLQENEGSTSSGGTEDIAEGSRNKKKGMVLPFEPYCITFDDIRYSVDMPAEMKIQGVPGDKLELLKGVSGAFRPGVLTALMGVSGAGKTTLMDVLAGRKTGGYIEGNIAISGYPKKQKTFARISGYCEQNDIHSPHVTVYESLLYSAWLRLPTDVKSETRKTFIKEVMDLVELTPLRDALVGLPGVNGLSTEQRKRLTIAVELVANPSIIFMDEPTSGLDARAAAIVMRTVRNTVDTGRTVVCTIHQPSIDIFEAFDELLLMKRGGKEIYVGPVGRHSCHLIAYFEGIEGVRKIEEGYNPSTWMLEVSTAAQEMSMGVDFSELYKNSDLYRRNKDLIKELSQPPPDSKDLYFASQYSQPFLIQCWACLWKQRQSYWRNTSYTAVRFAFTLVISLMLGTMFWKLGKKMSRPQQLSNAMASMYAAVIFLGVQNSASVQPVVDIERAVFYREQAAGMYSALAYAFAQALVEIPYIFTQTVIYGVLVYAMISFHWTAAKFFWYLFFMFFTLLYFTYSGMMAIGLTPNQNFSMIIAGAFYALWNLFSGFVVPRSRIHGWWIWFYWICPVAWTLYGMIASQYGDREETLSGKDTTVKQYLNDYYGFEHDFLGVTAAVVIAFTLFFLFMFVVSIKAFNFQKR